jgi:hypothetical protein
MLPMKMGNVKPGSGRSMPRGTRPGAIFAKLSMVAWLSARTPVPVASTQRLAT